MTSARPVPAVSFQTARSGASTNTNELGMRPMQERAYNKRGEQYLLIKSPPGLGQEPRTDVHRARQAAQSGASAGYHRGPGKVD